MGDNRDNSLDSRVENVGFIPVENLIGRAEILFFSVNGEAQFWEPWTWPLGIRYGRLLNASTSAAPAQRPGSAGRSPSRARGSRSATAFADPALLDEALTHASLAGSRGVGPQRTYERLEFLGDRVLG